MKAIAIVMTSVALAGCAKASGNTHGGVNPVGGLNGRHGAAEGR